jgi:hypothetical protein
LTKRTEKGLHAGRGNVGVGVRHNSVDVCSLPACVKEESLSSSCRRKRRQVLWNFELETILFFGYFI